MTKEFLRLLLVEDSDGDARLFQEAIHETGLTGLVTDRAVDLRSATTLLSEKDYHLVVLDLGLPDSWGTETLKAIQRYSGSTAIVVLSGLEDERAEVEVIQQGAQDFLPKWDLSARLLRRIIRYALERNDLRTRQRLLSRVVEETLTGIVLVSESGVVAFRNQSAKRYHVFAPFPEEAGDPSGLERLFIPEVAGQVDRTFRTGTLQSETVDLGPNNGPIRHIECTTYLQAASNGTSRMCIVQLVDVSERILYLQRLLAVEQAETVGILAGVMAHEFNNQLGILSGHLDVLGEMVPGPDATTHLRACEKAVAHAAGKTKELLAIAGRQQGNAEIIDLTEALSSVLGTTDPPPCMDPGGGREVPGSPVLIRMDRTQLDYILTALCDLPAERQAPSHHVEVELCLSDSADGTDTTNLDWIPRRMARVLIRVRHGRGNENPDDSLFTEIDLSNLLHDQLTWGLAVVHGMIRQHDGTFRIRRAEGRQTDYLLELPLA